MARTTVETNGTAARRTRKGAITRWMAGTAGLILAVGLIGACAGGSGDAASKTSGAGDSASGGSAAGPSAALAAELAKGPAAGTQVMDREVIYKGTVTVRVPNAEKAADEAIGFAREADGYLGKQDSQLTGERQVDVTLRIPADDFDAVMAKVAALGTVQARKVDSEDVTDQVVDLEGRLENARASTERLRELLAKAENVQNIAALEDRLTQREAEIEQISGQLEVIQDEVRFATVTATFTEEVEPEVSDDLPAPIEALKAGGVAFVTVVLGLLAAVAFALPFLVVAAIAWFGYRRWRRSHPKPEGPSAPTWPGAPPPPAPTWVPAPAAPTAPAGASSVAATPVPTTAAGPSHRADKLAETDESDPAEAAPDAD